MRSTLQGLGYQLVYTPHIHLPVPGTEACSCGVPLPLIRDEIEDAAQAILAEVGGDALPPLNRDGDEWQLRNSPCHLHRQIFLATPHSYRDLPYRLFEIADCYHMVNRKPISHTVVAIHTFLLEDQVQAEVERLESTLKPLVGLNYFGTPMTRDGIICNGPDNKDVEVVTLHAEILIPEEL